MFLTNPLEQFEITLLSNSFFTINTNTASFYVITFCVLNILLSDNVLNWEKSTTYTAENWIEDELKRYANSKRLDAWSFIITMPYVILAFNWFAFLPQFYVSFSTIVIPSFLATTFLLSANILAIAKYGYSFLQFYCPIKGEQWLRPFIFIIEIFAYLAKYLSVALRLFANILSGHVILEVLGNGTAMSFFAKNYVSFVITFVLTVVLFIMELFIAFAQAFLFIVLMCMYSADYEEH